MAAQSGCIGATLAGTDGSYNTPDTGLSGHALVQAVTAWEGMTNLSAACQIADTFADMLSTGILDVAYAVHGTLSLIATSSITNDDDLILDQVRGITTFKSGDHTYAAVTSGAEDGVQILNITNPSNITAAGSIIKTNDNNLVLTNAGGITTFKSGGSTYAAVAAYSEHGVQILNITNPSNITAAGSISESDDSSLVLLAPYAITTFESSGHIYAAVTAASDDGVQILNITNPSNITAAGSISESDDSSLILDVAQGIAIFNSSNHIYAAVASLGNNGVQILDITNPSNIIAAGSITDGGNLTDALKLSGARDIATFELGGSTYAAVAAYTENGVQILDITNPSNITAAGSISESDDSSLVLLAPYAITTFESSGHIYAAVTSFSDDGVQILDITDPLHITAAGSITGDGTNNDDLELNGAWRITTFESGVHTYIAVGAFTDDGVQILRSI